MRGATPGLWSAGPQTAGLRRAAQQRADLLTPHVLQVGTPLTAHAGLPRSPRRERGRGDVCVGSKENSTRARTRPSYPTFWICFLVLLTLRLRHPQASHAQHPAANQTEPQRVPSESSSPSVPWVGDAAVRSDLMPMARATPCISSAGRARPHSWARHESRVAPQNKMQDAS